ncbi:MAG: TonB-dependent receptor domain-containing protein, partial [Spongiibacter sp.]
KPGKVASDGISPRLMLRYDMSDDATLNAQISRGFRLGGINDPVNEPICKTDADRATFAGIDRFDDETLTNYEVGSKMTLFGGSATLNASMFYSDIEDLQATVTAGTCSSRLVYNVPKAHSKGLEVEFFSKPTANFEYGVSASYVDTEIESTVTSTDENGGVVVVGGIREGNEMPTAPGFEMAATATLYFPLMEVWEGYLNATYQFVGERYTQLADQENGGRASVALNSQIGAPHTQGSYDYSSQLDSYEQVNIRVGARTDAWDIALFARNATNEKADLSLDKELNGAARVGHHVSQPRTLGITARYTF